eukprot:6305789-Amphidinium_carterae.1
MVRSGLEFLTFQPRSGETLEALLLRYDMLLTRANDEADLNISYAFRTWILFTVLRLSPKKWADLLEKMHHRFPRDEREYRLLERELLREH